MNSNPTQPQLPLPEHEIRSPELYSQLKALPKVGLHRHLTGSMRTETIIDLARKNGIQLPTYEKHELEKHVTCPSPAKNYKEFMWPWLRESGYLFNVATDPEDFFRLTYETAEDAYRDNVKYLELRTSPFCLTNGRKLPYNDVLKSIKQAIDYAKKDFLIDVRVILSIPRHHWGWVIRQKKYNSYMNSSLQLLKASYDYKDEYVVGFDLTGEYENKYPNSMFADFFTTAKKKGFKISIHAGETARAESVKQAVNLLHADRIAHGLFVNEDEETLSLIKGKAVPLEICPTSNIRAGIIKSLLEHPIKQFYDLGITVTVNTDDPQYLKIREAPTRPLRPLTLTDEYYDLVTKLSFSIEDIKKIILNGVNAAFVGRTEKEKLYKGFCKTLGGGKDELFENS